MEHSLLYNQRHSLSHVLAQAVLRSVDPLAKLGIGPSIDTGFYYDFIFSDGVEFKEENLKDLNKFLQKIIKENQPFTRVEFDYDQAKEIITMLGEEFKIDLIDGFKTDGETVFSYYINSIPTAAKDKLLKDSKPGYLDKYEKITAYLQANPKFKKATEDRFVTFIDMCE